jgi:hypothetical protein
VRRCGSREPGPEVRGCEVPKKRPLSLRKNTASAAPDKSPNQYTQCESHVHENNAAPNTRAGLKAPPDTVEPMSPNTAMINPVDVELLVAQTPHRQTLFQMRERERERERKRVTEKKRQKKAKEDNIADAIHNATDQLLEGQNQLSTGELLSTE